MLRDESGRVAGMFCAVFETTGRVLAEQALREDVVARQQAEAALRELNETLERRVAAVLAERTILANIIEHTTCWPTVRSVTSAPTATIVPEHWYPTMWGTAGMSPPRRLRVSPPSMLMAATSTSTPLGWSSGSGTSS